MLFGIIPQSVKRQFMAFSILSESTSAAHVKIATLTSSLQSLQDAIRAVEAQPGRRLFIAQLLKWHAKGMIDGERWNQLLFSLSDPLSFTQETLRLLDTWRPQGLSSFEYSVLRKLTIRGELALVYDYLDLQKGVLSDHSSLEQALKQHDDDPKHSLFPFQIEMRRILQAIYSCFVCLPIELNDWRDPAALKKMQISLEVNLQRLLEQPGAVISVRKKLFMEEFLHNLHKSRDRQDFLRKTFVVIEEAGAWEAILEKFQEKLKLVEVGGYRDKALLEVAFAKLEDESEIWHKQLGKLISPLVLRASSLTDVQQAIKIGDFRLLFQEINDCISNLKARVLGHAVEDHLCCCCHCADPVDGNWPLNNRVLDLSGLQKNNGIEPAHSSLLIFTCGGGAGHLSAARAMAQAAKGRHHILAASTLEETLAPNDVLKKMKFDLSQEKLYNYLLKFEEFEWMKLVTSFGPVFLMMMQRKIERLIRLEVLKQNPDVLVSCIPIFNPMFLNIAKELELPLLIVTTDLDTKEFIKGMKKAHCDIHYPKYRITLAFDRPEMRAILEKKIPKEKVKVTGFPLRKEFTQEVPKKALDEARKSFDIRSDEKLLLIMMGGNAGLSIGKYAEILASYTSQDLPEALHVLCLCGDASNKINREMQEKIQALKPKSPQCRIQGIFATDRISELMTLAHAIISKPGGCTINEALSKLLPMIFHAPFALMSWEKFNMEFCIKSKLGFRFHMLSSTPRHLSYEEIIYNKKKLLPLLKEAFQRRDEVRNGDYHLEGKKNFATEFLHLIDELRGS